MNHVLITPQVLEKMKLLRTETVVLADDLTAEDRIGWTFCQGERVTLLRVVEPWPGQEVSGNVVHVVADPSYSRLLKLDSKTDLDLIRSKREVKREVH